MQLYKIRQRLGTVLPDLRILNLQPVETPFKKSWVRPEYYKLFDMLLVIPFLDCNKLSSH